MFKYLGLVILLLIVSCESSKKEESSSAIVYDMYEASEMANLMNDMYAYNEQLKDSIIAGYEPTHFPLEFLKLHSAELSNFKSRNENFEAFSKLFIAAEQQIFNTDSDRPAADRFNSAINLCISCHQTECSGPIPRIRKLLIP